MVATIWLMDTCTVLPMYPFPQENPECTVLCVYTHDSQWVNKRCLKQTIFRCILYFMFDVVDHSRVILKVPDETGCDYINASYINVSGNQCICVALDCVRLHTKYHSIFYCYSLCRATCKRVHTLPLKVCTHVLRYIQTYALLYIISMHSSVVAMHSHANTFTLDSHVCSICCKKYIAKHWYST